MFKVSFIIYLFLLFEYVFGGGGAFIQLGSVSLRSLIHFICLFLGLYLWLRHKLPPKSTYIINILGIWFFIQSFALIIGLFNDLNYSQAFIDIKGQLVLLLLPFLVQISRHPNWNIKNLIYVICLAGVINSILQIFLTISLFSGFINIDMIYSYFFQNNEVIFRNFPFLQFKSHIISLLALPFILYIRPKYYKLYALFIVIGIITTLSRASLFFLFLIFLSNFILKKRFKLGFLIKTLITLLIILIISFIGYDLFELYFNQRDFSQTDNPRISDINFILDKTSAFSFIFGNGIGNLINGRVNIENSYLWIYYKYGMLGLLLWIVFIFFTVKSTIKKLIITNDNFLIKPFLISISVILGYSFFNHILIILLVYFLFYYF